MQSSSYAKQVPAILAGMEQEREEMDAGKTNKEEDEQVVYIYPLEGGGVVFTDTPIEDEQQPSIIDSEPPPAAARKEPPYFLYYLLILCLFMLLDNVNSTLLTLFTPTATITITPQVKTISLHSTLTLGKLLSPLTISESQTVLTTGRGHQNATQATGTLTFYNGSIDQQTIPGGTIYSGSDGVQVATAQTVTVPAANLPQIGQVIVNAHAVNTGSHGNIAAGDINTAVSSSLVVKNLTAFTGGQDERDFSTVTQADRDTTGAILQAKVSASMTAALHGQLLPGEALQKTPCTPQITANHRVGDESPSLTVTVSETCTAIAYNTQELQQSAMELLTIQARKMLGSGYNLYGNIQVSVTRAIARANEVFLSFTGSGTWIYQINQREVTSLVIGKPRLAAIALLTRLPGIRRATITGIEDNGLLPTDQEHIRFLELVEE